MPRFLKAEDGLHAGAQKVSQAEALADRWLARLRPLWICGYARWRRMATIAVVALAGLLFLHVMFGANGMIVYRQKRAEYQSLQRRLAQEQKENDLYTLRIQGLKTDEKSIEKEAREQLHYVRPGEYVYVPPVAPETPPGNRSAKK